MEESVVSSLHRKKWIMKNTRGIKKLKLEKITISKLTNLNSVRGGSEEIVVGAYPQSEDVAGSNCVCTVTIALSEDCDPDDYNPFLNR